MLDHRPAPSALEAASSVRRGEMRQADRAWRIFLVGSTADSDQATGLAAELRRRGHQPVVALAGPQVSDSGLGDAQARAIPCIHVRADALEDTDYRGVERAGRELRRTAEAVSPDIVHVLAPEFAGHLSGWPLVVQAGAGPTTWWPAVRGAESPPGCHWRRHLTYRGLGAADAVTAPTQAHGDAVFARLRGLTAPHILAEGHTPLECASKDPFVLVVGAGWRDPGGFPALLQAASASNWIVLAGGPAPLPRSASQPVAHINWIGDTSHDLRRDYTRRAGIALALDLYAPSAIAPAEAASAGAALILSDIPSHQEVWRGCAIFVDPGEPAEIAFAINELAESETLRAGLGAAARERAALFTHAAGATASVALYQKVLRARLKASA